MNEIAGAASGGFVARLASFTRVVNKIFALLACLTTLAILLFVLTAVITRYFFNWPLSELLDLTTFMLVFVFFLALAPALESGAHIEVDLFDPLIPQSLHKAQRMVGKLLTLVFAAVLLWFVWKTFHDVVKDDELSFTMLTINLKYVYWIGPVGALQFLLTAIVDIARFAQTPSDRVAEYGAGGGGH
jgi:TRAP-type C4-dicarboxylate transport system permease small subunit